jgi:hypothetical protein
MVIFSKSGNFFRLSVEQKVPRKIEDVFSFFETPKNLNLITPPWLNFKIIPQVPETTYEGLEISYRLSLHKFPMFWKSRIINYEKNKFFCDKQILGPYLFWEHTHTFTSDGESTIINDEVKYKVLFGNIINKLFVRKDLNKIFKYRYKKIEEVFKK